MRGHGSPTRHARERRLLVAALAAGATASGASAQDPRIKPGISTAGIDLSDLTVTEAAARLDQQLAPRLQGDLILGAAGARGR